MPPRPQASIWCALLCVCTLPTDLCLGVPWLIAPTGKSTSVLWTWCSFAKPEQRIPPLWCCTKPTSWLWGNTAAVQDRRSPSLSGWGVVTKWFARSVRAKLIGGADVQPVEVVGRALLQPLVNSGHLLVPCRKLRRHIRAIDEARRVWRG